MKVIFAGTPDFATQTLRAIYNSKHELVCVLTQADKQKGRGQKQSITPVKELALSYGVDILQPTTLKNEDMISVLEAYKADVMVVVAYGLILPVSVINLFPKGAINVHASLLPKYRGASPIQQAILNGDKETGVTIMQMDKGLDTGDMLHKSYCKIVDEDNVWSLHDKLSKIGSQALIQVLDDIEQGSVRPTPQNDGLATYASKISKRDGCLNWQECVTDIYNKIRAYFGWPSAYSYIDGKRFKIWQATILNEDTLSAPGSIINVSSSGIDIACNPGLLRIHELQFDGGKRLPVADILNANKQYFISGATLTSCPD